jgi:hypothetical protein
MNLIFRNCFDFNPPFIPITLMAQEVEKKFIDFLNSRSIEVIFIYECFCCSYIFVWKIYKKGAEGCFKKFFLNVKKSNNIWKR